MPKIRIETVINAKKEICFDLSRSIELHKISTSSSNEEAIDGVTKGLISFGETVTWRAKHFGIYLKLKSKITSFNPYDSFTDEMIKGPFKHIKHIHEFKSIGDKTIMTDEFSFSSPFGLLGMLFNKLVLTSYLEKLLLQRNDIIKQHAEGNLWKNIISQ